MSESMNSALTDALIKTRRFFTPNQPVSPDGRTVLKVGGRAGDAFYRDRWSHEKVVRSTHGVNCTGSCSWNVYVKDGIITWETQAVDYPTAGPDKPEYEPRGCPRGASFSWYTYSPTRTRYPYIRGVLLDMYREAKARLSDPVLAWADITEDPERAGRYKSARGKGGLIRANWDEVVEIVAAAHVHTIRKWGPDRVAGFSPIPAMSMVSHASGARFVNLIGGSMLSFYDWYADMPVASPQMFGDQTDVPESGDWWDSSYLVMWGSNVPVTRTPDAHWMTEARYRGQKVIVVSPDFADSTKFADEWLPAQPGTDGALAMSMGHVILKEFYVDRQTPYFNDYVKKYTDLPYLVTLDPAHNDDGDPTYTAGKFLTAADLDAFADQDNPRFKTTMIDAASGHVVVPPGSLGHRFGERDEGKWNLELGDIDPLLSLIDSAEERVVVDMPRFDAGQGNVAVTPRGVPARWIDGHLVTTVFDLMLAQYGVGRPGLPGRWPSGYDDAESVYTPAWQEAITGVSAGAAERIGREFAQNAEDSKGRSMILMGAGTNHWFHSDTIYRTFMALTTITGCQGVNGGGWAHYVGQEKVRPLTGYNQLANALDWTRPPRNMVQTAYWYLHTDQFRYDQFGADTLTAKSGTGRLAGKTTADVIAQSARLGWMPSYPTFDRSPLILGAQARQEGKSAQDYVVDELKADRLKFAAEDPDAPENFPRVLSLWRSNLLGSSAKGNEYFLNHLLGAEHTISAEETAEEHRPREVTWHDEAPIGKLDLLTTLDFRMTSSTLLSDIVLPAATWYEKYDLSTTDMHPFVNSFNPAVSPPWESRNDWETWQYISQVFSRLAERHLGVQTDVVAAPLTHDTPDAMAVPHGRVLDWKYGECEPVPGVSMPKIIEVERDYTQIGDKMRSIGPLMDSLGATTKGVTFELGPEIEHLKEANGVVRGGVADGRPDILHDVQACEMILTLSGTTNGRLATEGFKQLETRTGTLLHDLAAENEGHRVTFRDTQHGPAPVITSPEWSGSETGGRRYSPFTINVERHKPWHTLTGRQQFYIDHDWITELGEGLPTFRPPLDMTALFDEPSIGHTPHQGITVRYLTPHNKWSIHSEYQDNLFMLSLFRGGPVIWMSDLDADKIGVRDNEWIEAVNRNGVVNARAVVSHRMPEGTAFMYHSQDRLIDMPISETTGQRGGNHNSLTRLMIKPTHMVGGYAQLSFAFNYMGPTGNQRDEVTVIRRRSQEVTY